MAALRAHLASTWFVKLDIADFFGSVSRSRIARLLKEFAPYRDALRMATSSTVRHPTEVDRLMLPYGFVQSPVIASLALAKSALGKYLRTLHSEQDLVVTVYMDDVIVSSVDEFRLADVAQKLNALAKRSRFEPNADKTHGPLSKLSAFNIELTDSAMAIAPSRLDQLKSVLEESTNRFQIDGIRSYVKSVNEEQAAEFGDPLAGTDTEPHGTSKEDPGNLPP